MSCFKHRRKIMLNYKTVSLVLGAVLLVAATAGASIYLTKQPVPPEKVAVQPTQPIRHVQHIQHAQNTTPKCDDGNIAGKAVGGVGGGVLGSLVGKGSGKTAATIGGTLGGAYLGGETIPLQNATCR
jgi:uncharacterized protein YcfJ